VILTHSPSAARIASPRSSLRPAAKINTKKQLPASNSPSLAPASPPPVGVRSTGRVFGKVEKMPPPFSACDDTPWSTSTLWTEGQVAVRHTQCVQVQHDGVQKCRDYRSHWSSWRQECNLFASILAQLASMSAVAQSTPPLSSGGAKVVRRGLEAVRGAEVERACARGAALAMGEDGTAAGSGVMEMMIARALAHTPLPSPCTRGGTVCLASPLDMALRCEALRCSQRRSFNSRLRVHVITSSPGNCLPWAASAFCCMHIGTVARWGRHGRPHPREQF
jgi:hypothetical protein